MNIMKKLLLLIGLGVFCSNSIFASKAYIENVQLEENYISVDVAIELTEDENVDVIKLFRKEGEGEWALIHSFADVENLHYDDNSIEDNHSYAYKVMYSTTNSVRSGQNRSPDLFSSSRKLTNWSAPRPDLKYRASELGLVNDQRHDAFISVYLSGKNGLKTGKTVFILDGFDPHNFRSVNKTVSNESDGRGLYHLANGDQNIDSEFYDASEPASQNFIVELRKRCYDIVFINWIEGAGDMEKNAKLFQNILSYYNKNSATANSSIVIGPSMGGVIARYALAEMEEKNIEHNVGLFISLDSPHSGANIPLAIQTLAKEALKVGVIENFMGKKLMNNLEELNSVAARQLLLYHHLESFNTSAVSGAYPAPQHKLFFDKLNALNSGIGWPTNCLKVGISNGSKKSGDKLFANHIDFINLNLFAMDYALTAIDNPNRVILEQNKGGAIKKFKISNYPLGVDNTQGGLINLPYLMNKQTFGNVNGNTHNCFIPLPSALGLKMNTPNLNHKWIFATDNILTKAEMMSQGMQTEFDLCFMQDKNQEHIFIGTKTKEFVLSILDKEKNEAIELNDFNTPAVIDYDRIESAINIVVGQVNGFNKIVVDSQGELELVAENKISFYPGFKALQGSKHLAHIGVLLDEDCSTEEMSFRRIRLIDVDEIDIEGPVEEKGSKSLSVFPNPTSGQFQISSNVILGKEKVRIEIWDTRGKKIHDEKISEENSTIYINDFENGIYFVKLITENDALTTKILKK